MGRGEKENGDLACGERTCGPVEVPTEEETEALDALRTIKGRVREIKAELQSAEEREPLEKELDSLREEWEAWQRRRKAAARERMVMLGHEDPG
jgi:chromosome segregation ATPase